ncbi:MAG: hypothetical protein V3V33_14300 [Candidatus Lokiarchaeia archaeon]
MIEYIFLVLFFVSAIVEVFAEYKNIEKIEYLTKPLLKVQIKKWRNSKGLQET